MLARAIAASARSIGSVPATRTFSRVSLGNLVPVAASGCRHRRFSAGPGQRPPSNQAQAMTVQELQNLLEDSDTQLEMQFVDVREEGEVHVARLPHFQLYPMSRMSEWMEELEEEFDFDRPTICLCHHGVRSGKVAAMLANRGFTNVYNVVGGIDAYSRLVDLNVPLY